MVKILSVLIVLSASAAGLYLLAPVVILNTVPSCLSVTTFITQNEQGFVVARGEWYSRHSGGNILGQYHGNISFFSEDEKIQHSYKTSVSYEQSLSFKGEYLQYTTLNMATNFDNEAPHAMIYRYVMPDLRAGTSNYLRLININHELLATSLARSDPRGICTKKF